MASADHADSSDAGAERLTLAGRGIVAFSLEGRLGGAPVTARWIDGGLEGSRTLLSRVDGDVDRRDAAAVLSTLVQAVVLRRLDVRLRDPSARAEGSEV